ncbi:cell division protein ZipA [Vibrio parahaemolyticus]|uniref:cell division protein ZipA n=1 Tax=Vibrio parahaemolyticus TaxID=670 RepID=UPI001A359F23|nr:cell division protein ZipA [Vibrio parahaemolyticus]HAS6777744.1 cell division protein ZipA [Vibrio parahaemolyticus]HAS6993201.1 cell division protein ZipA [Vibrio parahaemolyticus]
MQELRFVLIVVGALAIAALLFHGLWSSKKEGKAKFGNKPLGKLDVDQGDKDSVEQERSFAPAPEDDFEIIRKDRKEPDFGMENTFDSKFEADPLLGGVTEEKHSVKEEAEEIPSFVAMKNDVEDVAIQPSEVEEPMQEVVEEVAPAVVEQPEEPKPEPEMQVIVLNVHCAGEEPFIGTELFDSMQQNGLIYGEMHIFHRHVDLSGNGKVLFSVANMMHPGTLEHGDPAEFSTKGISFFMTLPCYGEAEQNFNLMLRTAQQIADDMGGNVLDDKRNLMTPDRLAAYRRQIVEFNAANA